MNLKKISIVTPVALDANPKDTLESVKTVDYPPKFIESFLIHGNRPCQQRNLAISKSNGELIFFLDNDCIFEKKLFKNALRHFDDAKVAAVGGPSLTAKGDSFLQKCFGYVMGSYFGTMSMRAKFNAVGNAREATEKELILCNMCMRKSVID